MKSVAFYTLGCKLNFSESSTIARQMEGEGFARAEFTQGADLYVINTCSVTENADRKCRKVVKEALKYNADASVVIIGCYAQLKPQEIAEIPGVDMVLGAAEKFNLVHHLKELGSSEKAVIHNKPIKETSEFVAGYSFGDRTRTFLKVQDGCNYFCSFCTIPLARGFSRSDTIANTIAKAQEVAQTGVKEVVLTGVNIGDFGRQNGETFFDLIKELDKVEGISRYRISSIEPNLLNEDIIQVVANSNKFVPHFHIPLQSGNNKILKQMRRRYQRELYAERIEKIKQLMPNCCIGVDVIVGFPGETEEDFLDTYNFINELNVSYLHVFPYSERLNTTAVRLEGVVPQQERSRRVKMLRILSEKKRRAFYEQHIGETFSVLFEAEENSGKMNGFTENYIKVKTNYDPLLVNEITQVKLTAIDEDGEVMVEEVVEPLVH